MANLDKIQGLSTRQRKALEEHLVKIGEPLDEEEVKEEVKKEVKPVFRKGRK